MCLPLGRCLYTVPCGILTDRQDAPLVNIIPLEYIENIIRQTIKKVGHSDLLEEIGKDTKLLIIVNPKRKFSVDQFDHLKHLLESGTSILILLNEEGEKASKSNINYFLEEYGMAVNSDVVIRTSFVQVTVKEVYGP